MLCSSVFLKEKSFGLRSALVVCWSFLISSCRREIERRRRGEMAFSWKRNVLVHYHPLCWWWRHISVSWEKKTKQKQSFFVSCRRARAEAGSCCLVSFKLLHFTTRSHCDRRALHHCVSRGGTHTTDPHTTSPHSFLLWVWLSKWSHRQLSLFEVSRIFQLVCMGSSRRLLR